MGDPQATQVALSRLMVEGLDRHDAIHAIASVLDRDIFAALRGTAASTDPGAKYVDRLAQLTAESWRAAT